MDVRNISPYGKAALAIGAAASFVVTGLAITAIIKPHLFAQIMQSHIIQIMKSRRISIATASTAGAVAITLTTLFICSLRKKETKKGTSAKVDSSIAADQARLLEEQLINILDELIDDQSEIVCRESHAEELETAEQARLLGEQLINILDVLLEEQLINIRDESIDDESEVVCRESHAEELEAAEQARLLEAATATRLTREEMNAARENRIQLEPKPQPVADAKQKALEDALQKARQPNEQLQLFHFQNANQMQAIAKINQEIEIFLSKGDSLPEPTRSDIPVSRLFAELKQQVDKFQTSLDEKLKLLNRIYSQEAYQKINDFQNAAVLAFNEKIYPIIQENPRMNKHLTELLAHPLNLQQPPSKEEFDRIFMQAVNNSIADPTLTHAQITEIVNRMITDYEKLYTSCPLAVFRDACITYPDERALEPLLYLKAQHARLDLQYLERHLIQEMSEETVRVLAQVLKSSQGLQIERYTDRMLQELLIRAHSHRRLPEQPAQAHELITNYVGISLLDLFDICEAFDRYQSEEGTIQEKAEAVSTIDRLVPRIEGSPFFKVIIIEKANDFIRWIGEGNGQIVRQRFNWVEVGALPAADRINEANQSLAEKLGLELPNVEYQGLEDLDPETIRRLRNGEGANSAEVIRGEDPDSLALAQRLQAENGPNHQNIRLLNRAIARLPLDQRHEVRQRLQGMSPDDQRAMIEAMLD